jgi:hypothetical protein
MQFQLDEAIEVLRRTPGILQAWLGGMPDPWLYGNEGPGTFTPFEVVGHLIYAEMEDWIPRTRMILEAGESQTFVPFDRRGHEPLIQGRSIDDLLREFAELRQKNLADLRSLQPDLEATGTHPEFGRVKLREMLASWVVHDMAHLSQIARVMAKQYKGAAGPWSAYMTILQ